MIRKLSIAGAIIGALLVALLICAALFADSLAGHDPHMQSFEERMSAPSRQHPYGTDHLGRDMQSRIIYGIRDDLLVAAKAALIALVAGGVLGAAAGVFGGITDKVILFFGRFLASGPAILLTIVLAARGFAFAGMTTGLMTGTAFMLIPGFIRVIRGIVLGSADTGTSIVKRALIISGAAAARVFLSIAVAILVYAGFGYLGLGAQPPSPELGAAIRDGRNYLVSASYLIVYPALALVCTTLSFNILGESLIALLQRTESQNTKFCAK